MLKRLFVFLFFLLRAKNIFINLLDKKMSNEMKKKNISGLLQTKRLFCCSTISFVILKSFVFGILMSTITFGGLYLSCFEGFAFAFTTIFKTHVVFLDLLVVDSAKVRDFFPM